MGSEPVRHPRDPGHRLIPDDQPLLSELAVLRYRDAQGYGVELLQRRETLVTLLDGRQVRLDSLQVGDKFFEEGDLSPSEVTSLRLGSS